MAEHRGRLIGPLDSGDGYEANKTAFEAAAANWRARGWLISSPIENFGGCQVTRQTHQRLNLYCICEPCGRPGFGLSLDALIALPGWEQSPGALLEMAVAHELGLPVLDAVTGEEIVIASTNTEITTHAEIEA